MWWPVIYIYIYNHNTSTMYIYIYLSVYLVEYIYIYIITYNRLYIYICWAIGELRLASGVGTGNSTAKHARQVGSLFNSEVFKKILCQIAT